MTLFIPTSQDFYATLPYILLATSGIVFLIFQFFVSSKDRWILRFISLFIVLVAMYFVYTSVQDPGPGRYFQKNIKVSELVKYLNILYLLIAFFTILASPTILRKHGVIFPELYPLVLFATLGMMVMTAGMDFIVVFIGIEIMSLSLYILVGMARNTTSALEAAIKYFLLGSFSSGFMLLGIAFLFGGSGTTDLELALQPIGQHGYLSNYTMLGLGLFLVGLFFKIALVPFHAWTPDVYEGSLTTITGFMASGPKASALALMYIIYTYIPFGQKTEFWFTGLALIAGVSMTWGNLVALRQNNLKRMLAYSSIAHAGYVAAGVVGGANAEILYYLFIYSVMSLVSFSIVAYLENAERQVSLESIAGLSFQKPWSAIGLSITMLSLAGFPPFAGFWAKFFLFQKLAESEQLSHLVLLVTGVVNSTIAFFYYIKPIIYSYMNREQGEITKSSIQDTSFGLLMVSGFGVVLLGIVWIFFQPSSF